MLGKNECPFIKSSQKNFLKMFQKSLINACRYKPATMMNSALTET